MKKTLLLFRLSIFVGALLVLRAGIQPFPAQQRTGDQCVTYDAFPEPCPSCCTEAGNWYENEIEGVLNGCGTQSDYLTPSPCGEAAPGGCSVGCTGQYDQALDDSACGAGGQEGMPCPPMGNCCDGLMCLSSGVCGYCSDVGEPCSTASDCCDSNSAACAFGVCCYGRTELRERL